MKKLTKRFALVRDAWGYATAIKCGKQWVLHLQPGTELNAQYADWIVKLLNRTADK